MATTIRCANCGKLNRVRPTPSGVPRCGVCHESLPWIVEADEESFDAELAASVPVLVDFWAPWCGPCRMVSPVVEQAGRDRAGRLKVVKLNVDGAPGIAGRYGVQGIPLLVLLRGGKELDRLVGAASDVQLGRWLDQHLTAAERPRRPHAPA
jgi:thioredoxin 2